MLHLIPASAHRAAMRLAHALRTIWWRLRRPCVTGCRVLALDGEGRVLLIRHSYGSGKWMPPSGGMARDEDAVQAALRELGEEVGCTLAGAAEVAFAEEHLHGAINRVHVVAGRIRGEAHPDGREVIAARMFPLDDLPADMTEALRRQVPGWAARYRAHS